MKCHPCDTAPLGLSVGPRPGPQELRATFLPFLPLSGLGRNQSRGRWGRNLLWAREHLSP